MAMGPKYKKMLQGMLAREAKQRRTAGRKGKKQGAVKKAVDQWFLYILRCGDGSLYTGVTNDLQRRLKMHNNGKASRYTRTRRPVELLYQENGMTRTQALVRECAIKSLPRRKKEELVLERES